MKTKTKKIKKGRHFACGLPAFLDGMGITEKGENYRYCRKIQFDSSCEYILNDGNQLAWSKLCGFCYGLFGIHRDSFRFGWRYNPANDIIEIAALIYNDGKVIRQGICAIEPNELYKYKIILCRWTSTVNFLVLDMNSKIVGDKVFDIRIPKSRLRFGCGFYFGGKSKAPNDMEIKIVEEE